jgi:hypothetical protein
MAVIMGIAQLATHWRKVWPRGVRAEVRDAQPRLPRRFYVLAGAVLVCLVAVVLAFAFLGGQGILVLIPAAVIAIPCFSGAVNIARRIVLPSPEKRAVAAAAAVESAAPQAPSAAAVNEFFASLESPPPGQATAASASDGRKASAAWNLAEPVAVSRGERLPVRLKTDPFAANKGKMGVSLYILLILLMLVVVPAVHVVRLVAAPQAAPNRGAGVATMAAVGVAGVAGISLLLGIGWRQFRRVSGVIVEVSAHPFPAGQSQEVAVYHANPAAVERLRLELLCEEDAYTGRGKHGPMTETKVVLRQPVPLDPPVDPGEVRRGRTDVPLAPCSFSLRLHRVRWCLQARLGLWVLRYPVEVRDRPLEAGALAPPVEERPPNRVDMGAVSLWIDGDTTAFLPGATMTGGFRVRTHPDAVPLRKIELSVLWWAEKPRARVFAGLIPSQAYGAQDSPDMGVCHFEEYEAASDGASDLGARRQFRVVLPVGPPSFHGKQFDITWTVRLRVGYADGDQSVCDLPFVLGGSVGTHMRVNRRGVVEEQL